jgi:putative membrane protein
MHKVFKGALAGLAGGVAGAAAKAYAEKIFPPRTKGQTPPPLVLVERNTRSPLNEREKVAAIQNLHWAFGGLAGAAYGVTVEFLPRARAGKGVAFGLLLDRLTHEGALPAYGLAVKASEQQTQERRSERLTHAVYGAVTEVVRSVVRRRL